MDSLPVDEALPRLKEAQTVRNAAVLVAPPGAGKTTRVPLALLDAPWLGDAKIVIQEPRRLAARAAAPERGADGAQCRRPGGATRRRQDDARAVGPARRAVARRRQDRHSGTAAAGGARCRAAHGGDLGRSGR